MTMTRLDDCTDVVCTMKKMPLQFRRALESTNSGKCTDKVCVGLSEPYEAERGYSEYDWLRRFVCVCVCMYPVCTYVCLSDRYP